MFGGLTHEPAVRLAARLVDITPAPLQHVFFSDSGSVSVEVAIKMALQYWRSKSVTGRSRLLTWRGGYHGDTFGAMAVCDPVGGMHTVFSDVLAQHEFVAIPPAGFAAELDPAYVAELDRAFAVHGPELAAVIVEPVIQGAGGMRFHAPGYLRLLRELCDREGILLIFDEIATGFGRSGALFAADHAGVAPDIMCLGKALTGGYLSMAATLCTEEVAHGIAAGEAAVLMHGPTFMANPLAAAVADANVGLLLGRDWAADVRRIETGLTAGLGPAVGADGVADVRVLGAVGVIEMDAPVDVASVAAAAAQRGVWLRPFRNLIYTMPPYITQDADVRQIAEGMLAAAAAAADAA
jgi:adenosylmethionine-8-amino-7-oxononanoate aminotransferase